MLPDKKRNTNIGIGIGILLQIISRLSAESLGTIALGIGLVGTIFFIWGCFNYAAGKGYSKWLGLLSLLYIFGLLILVIMPDKHKQK